MDYPAFCSSLINSLFITNDHPFPYCMTFKLIIDIWAKSRQDVKFPMFENLWKHIKFVPCIVKKICTLWVGCGYIGDDQGSITAHLTSKQNTK